MLDRIRALGTASRVELAEQTGLTDATISHIVRQMIVDGLVVESGFGESTGGKRRTLLEIDGAARSAVGVSLARDRIAIVLTDLAGAVIGRRVIDGAQDEHPEEVLRRISGAVDRVVAEHDVARERLVGIGIAGPGPLDTRTGTLRGRQPSEQWNGYPLEERAEHLTGSRVLIDNDATCVALGEHWTRRRTDPAAVEATVFVGEGVGCGILIEGRVFHGATSNAGEIGHISLDVAGPSCHCGSRGCVEVYAAPSAIVSKAIELGQGDRWGRSAREASLSAYGRIARAATRGDADAEALLRDAAAALGRGVIALANVLDLDEVTLSGPAFVDAGRIWRDEVQEQVDRGTFMRAIHPVRVVLSTLGVDAAAIGAAALILQEQMTPHSSSPSRRR
ncbi:ROK family transcriptional regulator [Microcella daejeonensis]|uniref:ROK family protein n=1 Tax=Microcella daejeonensis TaxID=2994971 RepID=UPI00226DA441|nr:ROK family transcriptional regulator [Microcella daejeonensis]WAB84989.1 ROK family transcriptional regulator [Microcella daejeonensis]